MLSICDKTLVIIYAYLECIIENLDECRNNPENSSTTKVSKHIPSSSFRSIENKHHVYRGKYCLKKFCEYLREHAKKKLIFKKKRKNEILNKRAARII